MGKEQVCECGDILCQGSVGFHRGQDSALYDLYSRKLLIRGWAGIYTPEEEVYRQEAKPPSEAMKERGRVLSARQKLSPMAQKPETRRG